MERHIANIQPKVGCLEKPDWGTLFLLEARDEHHNKNRESNGDDQEADAGLVSGLFLVARGGAQLRGAALYVRVRYGHVRFNVV